MSGFIAGSELELRMRQLISTIESMPFFDEKKLEEESGLGPEAIMLFKSYVTGKGLIPRASINYQRLGLKPIIVTADLKANDAEVAKTIADIYQRNGFLLSWSKPFGSRTIVSRHSVPKEFLGNYKESFQRMVELGLLKDFKWIEFGKTHSRFSFEPCVFDYSQGSWRAVPGDCKPRTLKGGSSEVAPQIDEYDLKILVQLKRTAIQSCQSLANAIGLSLDETMEHLKNHVLGGGDKSKSMINSYYIDFLEPGLFAYDTVFADCIFTSNDASHHDKLVSELLGIPYLIFIRADGNVHATFAFPTTRLYQVTSSIERAAKESDIKDYEYFLTPWYNLNVFTTSGDLGLFANFEGGKWHFEEDMVIQELTHLANYLGVTA
ncbi:hypothetical protein PQ610_07125 [Tardisphaera miroshnichenkoae]